MPGPPESTRTAGIAGIGPDSRNRRDAGIAGIAGEPATSGRPGLSVKE